MRKIGIVAHDAGGAYVLASWIKNNNYKYYCYIKGPAKKIIGGNGCVCIVDDIDSLIRQVDEVILGTGWMTDFERKCIKQAIENNIRTIVVFDHWSDYYERLLLDGEVLKPDEIWVQDNYAKEIAEKIFPDTRIKKIIDYYLESELIEINQVKKDKLKCKCKELLYIAEPIDDHLNKTDVGYGGAKFTEKDYIEYALKNIDVLGEDIDRIRVRNHPSEEVGKYYWVKEISNKEVVFSEGNRSLAEDIASCDLVVGVQSMALIVALNAGKITISNYIPGRMKSMLPHRDLKYLCELIDERKI